MSEFYQYQTCFFYARGVLTTQSSLSELKRLVTIARVLCPIGILCFWSFALKSRQQSTRHALLSQSGWKKVDASLGRHHLFLLLAKWWCFWWKASPVFMTQLHWSPHSVVVSLVQSPCQSQWYIYTDPLTVQWYLLCKGFASLDDIVTYIPFQCDDICHANALPVLMI